ncbi:MAG: regulatory iron-sulfur-containing complex subunit RicT [Bacilli bacterium]|nr:regulatory iron-sulfur-containing complex subunit RicT [Bacilli bacterium]
MEDKNIYVVGISFKDKGKVYNFNPNGLKLYKNVTVIVETERGLQFAKVIKTQFPIKEENLKKPLSKVVRISTKEDYLNHLKNVKNNQEALQKCRELVKKLKLNMNIIDANYTFDREQLVFQFTADSRIDFRSLAKELASIYKTRIELRQIGARDKAKEIGGIGICGRQLCCFKFLNDLDSVSINMAKNQNISLNPNKINGCCGRLLCCLKYEDDTYKECRKCLPQLGDIVTIAEGQGKVINIDIIKGKYTVNIKDVGNIEVKVNEFKCD